MSVLEITLKNYSEIYFLTQSDTEYLHTQISVYIGFHSFKNMLNDFQLFIT